MSSFFVIIIAVLLFLTILVVHEGGHYVVARLCGIQVNEFSIGMGPKLLQVTRGGIEYTLRLLPIGAYVAMEGEDSPESTQAEERAQAKAEEEARPRRGLRFNEAAIWKRMAVVVAGAMMNLVLGFVFLLFVVAGDEVIVSTQIHSFSEGAACHETGLEADDIILSVNGRRCVVSGDISYELSRTENYQADFVVRRNGQKVTLNGVKFDKKTDPATGEEYMSLGFIVYGLKKTPLRVMKEAAGEATFYGRMILTSLVDLIRGRESINNISGPVGIVSAIGEAAGIGLDRVVLLMTIITINLGIFNLLPIPALDGGKLCLLTAEAVIRKPIPENLQIAVNLLGFVLLIGLMLFATYQDLLRLFF